MNYFDFEQEYLLKILTKIINDVRKQGSYV